MENDVTMGTRRLLQPVICKIDDKVSIDEKSHRSRQRSNKKIFWKGIVEIVSNECNNLANAFFLLISAHGFEVDSTLFLLEIREFCHRFSIARNNHFLTRLCTAYEFRQLVLGFLDRNIHGFNVATGSHLVNQSSRR